MGDERDDLTVFEKQEIELNNGTSFKLGELYSMFESRILRRICSDGGGYESELMIYREWL